MHLHDVARHPRAFQLEGAHGMPLANVAKNFRIINGDVLQGQVDAMALLDQFTSSRHNRERSQTQEVNFEQAKVIDTVHIVLGYGFDR